MTYRSILLPIGAAVVFGGLLFVKSYGNKQMNAMFDSMPQPPVTVSAAKVQWARWPQEIKAVGSFAAVNGAELATEVGGNVNKIGFKNGQFVKAGEVLLQLDTEINIAQLKVLEAAARLAELELGRAERLIESRSVSEAELDAAQSRAEQARANVEAQRARIAQKTIVAPFDGVLGIRRVNLGQYVGAGTPVVSLQSLNPIFLNFMLPQQRLADVSIGQEVTAYVDAYPDLSFEGTVTAIEPRVEQSTRNFAVQASFQNPDGKLRPGMFARAMLEYGAPQHVLTVPQTAISFNPYGNSVYVVHKMNTTTHRQTEQGANAGSQASAGEKQAPSPTSEPALTVTQRFVLTGSRRGDLIAIKEGLKAGEQVATSGLLKLRNDAVVNINNEVTPKAELTPTPPNS
ncbi:MAG TPA: efflux RND transporter periplasmic adaptor subunit [Gammaproteobacteria bacterium]|nr:efflux RND transporter periplasmic adaptor subunit [Gammaproteobacteria bacterium]